MKAVGAKLLHVVDETFYSIPIDGANCRYLVRLTSGVSVVWYKPVKRGFRTAASPMLKSEKDGEKEEGSMIVRGCIHFPCGEFMFYT